MYQYVLFTLKHDVANYAMCTLQYPNPTRKLLTFIHISVCTGIVQYPIALDVLFNTFCVYLLLICCYNDINILIYLQHLIQQTTKPKSKQNTSSRCINDKIDSPFISINQKLKDLYEEESAKDHSKPYKVCACFSISTLCVC